MRNIIQSWIFPNLKKCLYYYKPSSPSSSSSSPLCSVLLHRHFSPLLFLPRQYSHTHIITARGRRGSYQCVSPSKGGGLTIGRCCYHTGAPSLSSSSSVGGHLGGTLSVLQQDSGSVSRTSDNKKKWDSRPYCDVNSKQTNMDNTNHAMMRVKCGGEQVKSKGYGDKYVPDGAITRGSFASPLSSSRVYNFYRIVHRITCSVAANDAVQSGVGGKRDFVRNDDVKRRILYLLKRHKVKPSRRVVFYHKGVQGENSRERAVKLVHIPFYSEEEAVKGLAFVNRNAGLFGDVKYGRYVEETCVRGNAEPSDYRLDCTIGGEDVGDGGEVRLKDLNEYLTKHKVAFKRMGKCVSTGLGGDVHVVFYFDNEADLQAGMDVMQRNERIKGRAINVARWGGVEEQKSSTGTERGYDCIGSVRDGCVLLSGTAAENVSPRLIRNVLRESGIGSLSGMSFDFSSSLSDPLNGVKLTFGKGSDAANALECLRRKLSLDAMIDTRTTDTKACAPIDNSANTETQPSEQKNTKQRAAVDRRCNAAPLRVEHVETLQYPSFEDILDSVYIKEREISSINGVDVCKVNSSHIDDSKPELRAVVTEDRSKIPNKSGNMNINTKEKALDDKESRWEVYLNNLSGATSFQSIYTLLCSKGVHYEGTPVLVYRTKLKTILATLPFRERASAQLAVDAVNGAYLKGHRIEARMTEMVVKKKKKKKDVKGTNRKEAKVRQRKGREEKRA